MKKLISLSSLCAFVFIVQAVFADSSEQSNDQDPQSYADLIKGIRLGLELELDNALVRDEENSINGLEQVLSSSLSSDITDSQKLAMKVEVSHLFQKNQDDQYNVEGFEVGHSYETKLPVIDTDFINTLSYFYTLNKDKKEEELQNGSLALLTQAATPLNAWLALESELEIKQFLRTSGQDGVKERELNLQTSPVVSMSDKISFALPVAGHFSSAKNSKRNGFEEMSVTPEFSYKFLPALNLKLYAEMVPVIAYDNETIASDFTEKTTFGSTLTYNF
ncbi:MAG: hypothetical protein HQK50_11975 [Oligoflexia bacterium]|nr:hypothetical protein [Oligoflexia bacterium]